MCLFLFDSFVSILLIFLPFLFVDTLRDRPLFYIIGVIWLISLPHPIWQKNTYVDENALLPGQVSEQIYNLT